MPQLTRVDEVFVLDLGDDENRFHPDWVASVDDALETVRTTAGPRALVTVASGRFYSNGLVEELLSADEPQRTEYLDAVEGVFARVLALPVISVAAVQGHAFAAGAMLSLAHDFRVMRADRGFWCLPEVAIGIPFTPGMSALVQSRLQPQVAHEAMATARRFGGGDALLAGIVDRAVPADEVLESAIGMARAQVDRAGETLGRIKAELYRTPLARLRPR